MNSDLRMMRAAMYGSVVQGGCGIEYIDPVYSRNQTVNVGEERADPDRPILPLLYS